MEIYPQMLHCPLFFLVTISTEDKFWEDIGQENLENKGPLRSSDLYSGKVHANGRVCNLEAATFIQI